MNLTEPVNSGSVNPLCVVTSSLGIIYYNEKYFFFSTCDVLCAEFIIVTLVHSPLLLRLDRGWTGGEDSPELGSPKR